MRQGKSTYETQHITSRSPLLVGDRSELRTPPPEITAHLRRTMQEQLKMVLSHLSTDALINPMFVREHTMIVVQMAEVLLEPDERMVKFDQINEKLKGVRSTE